MSGIITLGGEGVYVFLFMYVIFIVKPFFVKSYFFQATYKFIWNLKSPPKKEQN